MGQELSLRDYIALLRRRRWILLACIVIVPVGAWLFASREPAVYSATATVATKEGNLASTVSGIQDNSYLADPVRLALTQIALAQTPQVAAAVLRRAKVTDESANALLSETAITSNPNADLLYFTVRDRSATRAAELANAYATQYTVFRTRLDTQPYITAEQQVLARAKALSASGHRSYARTLIQSAEHLQTLAELETGAAIVAVQASGGAQIAPNPRRAAMFGLGIGLVLGIGLALVLDALDTRIRGPEDVALRSGLPLLARIPEPPRALQRDEELVLAKQPASLEAEAFRVLRTNLAFASIDHPTRSIMITSALEKEGKSTTIANLAIVEARAGKRVVLVDLDLRRPRLDRFFDLGGRPGLTDIILGQATVAEATAHIPLGPEISADGNGNGVTPAASNGHAARSGHPRIEGTLDVIPAGPIPPEPGEFVATSALARLLEGLQERYDLVLIDAPPLLRVGDALTLAPNVSALMVVARLPGLKRPILHELRRVLDLCPTRTLGFVVTGSQAVQGGYGHDTYYEYAPRVETAKAARVG